MTYFAGNTSKFMNGGVDVTALSDLQHNIDALNRAAELDASYTRAAGALGAYADQQDAIAQFNIKRDLESIQQDANSRTAMLDGIGGVAEGIGGLVQGLNNNSSNPFGLPSFNFEDSVSNLPADAFTKPPIRFADALNMNPVADVNYTNSFTGRF